MVDSSPSFPEHPGPREAVAEDHSRAADRQGQVQAQLESKDQCSFNKTPQVSGI